MTISRVTILDYVGFGKRSLNGRNSLAAAPKNPEEMRAQCKDLAFIPERITDLEMVESTLDKLVIKLPPKEMIEESERIIPGLASYPLPTY